ncbi:hypothetical protein H8356DRAFT_1316574 [Neocallimastix lanati (nom. inval.)]|nr:hypothetical protein H8356DRAFT_1316574 [Neocallimastix sp. JGI-2020a]
MYCYVNVLWRMYDVRILRYTTKYSYIKRNLKWFLRIYFILYKLKKYLLRRRRSQLPISKETPYRSTLRDPRGKAEPTIGGVLAIPEELDTVNPLRQGLRNGILIVLEI